VADDQNNPGDLRIPISVTIPWRRTLGGQLWPLDRRGRYWPEDRRGDPQCPLYELPPGFAPGMGKESVSIGEAARSYLAYLDAEKAAYGHYGSQSVPTLTVTQEASGQAVAQRPVRGHHSGGTNGTAHGTPAERAARLGTMMLIVGGTVIAEGEAFAILAALMLITVTAEIALKWLDEQRRFADRAAATAFVRGKLGLSEEHEALIPPPPTPVLPPAPPPSPRPDNEGLTLPRPTPAQPGFTPAPPTSLAPPETIPAPPVSPVMASQSRPGTDSRRSRAAARKADPEVVEHLSNSEWRAHHLWSIAALGLAPKLVQAAEEAGWSRNDASNMAALPANKEAQQRLRQAGIERPVHDNGHPKWIDSVRREMRNAEREFDRSEGMFRDVRTRGRVARRFLEQEARKLREGMMHLDRITSTEVPENARPT